MNPQYFEGVLQLRNPTQEIIDFVANEVEKRDNVRIAKTVRQERGIDIYLSSNRFLRVIGRLLQERFPGEMIPSKRIFTRHHLTSKDVYRGCVLFRHYDVKKGDIITVRGERFEVIALSKKILARDVLTKKKKQLMYNEL